MAHPPVCHRLRKQAYVAKNGTRRTAMLVVADNMIMLGHGTKPAAAPVTNKLVREDVDVDEVGQG